MHRLITTLIIKIACLLMLPVAAFAQLPTPTYGWNLGNTLEPPSGEGTWGPAATQSLINTVADSGFNVVRLPVAWNSHANQSNYQIDPAWMARVKQVVDWCYARNLTVIVNSHWDGGWLERNITDTVDPIINAKMQSYWTQIATAFAGYDNRLLFAGTNEPDAETAAQWNTLLAYQQTFVNAVRATGGNNSNRWLVIQGPRTDIDRTVQLVSSLPSDSASGRLVFEVHFYPFQFCLLDKDEVWGKMHYFWGQGYHHPTRTDRNGSVAENEAHVDAQFQKMADKFVSQGIPVIIGEFAAMKRTGNPDLTGADFNLHLASRTYYHRYVVQSAISKGLKPIYWDVAGLMFDWSTGAITDNDSVRALTGGAALPPPGGGGIIANGMYKLVSRHSGKALEVGGFGLADGSNVQQWGYVWGENQRWMVTHLGNNQYSVIGADSGKALDVQSWGTTAGSNVHIWTYGGGANQKWTITATGGGYYRLTPTHATGMCLDVSGVSTADGANVHIWTYGGANNQQWAFEAP